MTKQQILIVDDEEINRLILDGMFEGEGYDKSRIKARKYNFTFL